MRWFRVNAGNRVMNVVAYVSYFRIRNIYNAFLGVIYYGYVRRYTLVDYRAGS